MIVLAGYGAVLCFSLYFLGTWHRTPGIEKCSKLRSHLHLSLGAIACAICSMCSLTREQDQQIFQTVFLFVLPVISTLGDSGGSSAQLAPCHIYLGAHSIMTCMHFLHDFWRIGWIVCCVSFIFDFVLWRFAQTKLCQICEHHELTKLRQLVRELLDNICDGYCLLDESGLILLSDPNLSMLLERKYLLRLGNQQPLCGEYFSSLTKKPLVRPELGQRTFSFCTDRGGDIDVEAFTLPCLLGHESIVAVLGPSSESTLPKDLYLSIFRKRESANSKKGGERGRYSTLSDLKPSGTPFKSLADLSGSAKGSLSDVMSPTRESGFMRIGSDVGRNSSFGFGSDVGKRSVASDLRWRKSGSRQNSDIGNRCSEAAYNESDIGFDEGDRDFDNCSCVSSTIAPSGVGLESRLKLMDRRASAQVFFELDLPSEDGSNIGSSIVSETLHTPHHLRARMRLKRGNNRPRSSESENAITSSVSEEEEVIPEVLDSSPGPHGKTRFRFGFTSQMLCEQQEEMDELRRGRDVMEGLHKDSKAVLQNFQKIVKRQFSQVCQEGPPNIKVFICEECLQVRTNLMRDCQMLGYRCQAYDTIDAVHNVLLEEELNGCRNLCTVSGVQPRRPSWHSLPPQSPSSSAAHLGPPARMVLLGESLLEQLPVEWREDRIFVVLVCNTDGFTEEETSKHDPLRKTRVNQIMPHNVSLESWRCLAQEALQWCFGDEFLLTNFLGSGASGAVHLAKRLRDGESFALKQVALPRGGSKSAKKTKTVCREAELIAKLRWPALLYVFDAWWAETTQSMLYMLMPPMQGGDVGRKINSSIQEKCKIKAHLIVDWYVQALDGLTYLHWCGLVHRDLKPSNILLDTDERTLRIGDFGAAMMVPAASSHPRRRNCVKGSVTTPSYSAEEVYCTGLFYASSDLWSLGATFYEVLVLKPLIVVPSNSVVRGVLGALSVNLQPYEEAVQSIDLVCLNEALDVATQEHEGDGWIPNKLLQEIAKELANMLHRDHLKRPLAAILLNGDRWKQRLQDFFCECGPLLDPLKRQRHFEVLKEIVEQSLVAQDLDPPDSSSPRSRGGSRRPSICSKASSANSPKLRSRRPSICSKASSGNSPKLRRASVSDRAKSPSKTFGARNTNILDGGKVENINE